MSGEEPRSRSREAAGRWNWPEAVPAKMRCRKRFLTEIGCDRDEKQTQPRKMARTVRNATPPSGRCVWGGGPGDSRQAERRALLATFCVCLQGPAVQCNGICNAVATVSALPSIGHQLGRLPSCDRQPSRYQSNRQASRQRRSPHLCRRLAIPR